MSINTIEENRSRNLFGDHDDAASTILQAARERTDRSRVAALLSEELQASDGALVAAIADLVTWSSILAGDTLFERGFDSYFGEYRTSEAARSSGVDMVGRL